MAIDKIELRVLICYCWKRGLSTRKAAEVIRAADGEGSIVCGDSLYYKQLEQVDERLKQKYPALINRNWPLVQQNNVKLHTARKIKDKFEELDGVEVLLYPAYSPDCAASDYGLFRPMQHFLKGFPIRFV